MLFQLLPGVKVVIANPETRGQCADSHLGEVSWTDIQCLIVTCLLSFTLDVFVFPSVAQPFQTYMSVLITLSSPVINSNDLHYHAILCNGTGVVLYLYFGIIEGGHFVLDKTKPATLSGCYYSYI